MYIPHAALYVKVQYWTLTISSTDSFHTLIKPSDEAENNNSGPDNRDNDLIL